MCSPNKPLRLAPFGGLALRILVVEDDAETASYLVGGLEEEGHAVNPRGQRPRRPLILAMTGDFDLLIVDRMLPGIDGLTLVKTLRQAGN